MDTDFFRLVFVVSVLELAISRSVTERYVKVTESVCNSTYTFNSSGKMTLEYRDPINFFGEELKPVCYLNIVNNDMDRSICIKEMHHSYFMSRMHRVSCVKMFRYFIGYLPDHLQNGYTCSDFMNKPLCTDKSEVYAVFNDVDESLLYPAKVEIYTKGKYDPITTTRPTTPYWHDNNNNEYNYNYDDDDDENSMDSGTILKIVAGILCFFVILFVGIGSCKSKKTSTTNQQPDNHIDTTWKIDDPSFLGGGRLGLMDTPTAPVASTSMITPTVPVAPTSVINPTALEDPLISTSLPSNNDQSTPHYNFNTPIFNQSPSSDPPPSYDDLDFKSLSPPPCIGQGE